MRVMLDDFLTVPGEQRDPGLPASERQGGEEAEGDPEE